MNNQRSLLAFLLTNALALSLVFAFVSGCKKNDDPSTSTSTSIQGTWKITNLNVSPAFVYQPLGLTVTEVVQPLGLLEPGCISNATVTFNNNGTISNNVSSLTACSNATISKQLINSFFSSSTTYTETDNQVTLTTNGQNVVATKSTTATTATLTAPLNVRPDGTVGQTTYTMLLTKQ